MLELRKGRAPLHCYHTPMSFRLGVVAHERVLSMDKIELKSALMLNWTAWNRTVLTFKLRTYINWIAWNTTVLTFKLNCLKYFILHLTLCFALSARAIEYIESFCAEKQDFPSECPGFDTKQSDSEVLVMLELYRIRSTPSLPLLPGPLGLGVAAPDRILSMG